MANQGLPFSGESKDDSAGNGLPKHKSSSFVNNMRLPVHRWVRYSAGFSGSWAEQLIRSEASQRTITVFDPFAGSGTTLIAAEFAGVKSWGVDSHPFVAQIARAKLSHRSSPAAYGAMVKAVLRSARRRKAVVEGYPPLIRRCYSDESLLELDRLRKAVVAFGDDSPAARLTWLTLVGILRKTSQVNTASWQYVLPRKAKKNPASPVAAFEELASLIQADMLQSRRLRGAEGQVRRKRRAYLQRSSGQFGEPGSSPLRHTPTTSTTPTPLGWEMTFMREIDSWGDLQGAVRQYLVRSCSQHVPERAVDLDSILVDEAVAPIRKELTAACEELAEVRKSRGGRKTYHLMIAGYFLDMAQCWRALRRVCKPESRVCFVIGDSAPYGVYIPVIEWMSDLARAAGFHTCQFGGNPQKKHQVEEPQAPRAAVRGASLGGGVAGQGPGGGLTPLSCANQARFVEWSKTTVRVFVARDRLFQSRSLGQPGATIHGSDRPLNRRNLHARDRMARLVGMHPWPRRPRPR